MKIKNVIQYIEDYAPLTCQEDFDNSGLIVGNEETETNSALLCVDITEEIVDEAISKNINLIISHHPVVFSGLKKITGQNSTQRIVAKAIKHDIALYAAHTNMDNVKGGVNTKICEKLGLADCKILSPRKNELAKIAVFVPESYAEKVRNAMFEAGAGNIGEYSDCSFCAKGKGTFKAGKNTNPFVGNKGKLHIEDEIKIEMIAPKNNLAKIKNAILKTHPYEEVACDIYSLDNKYENTGSGMIGNLPKPVTHDEFYKMLKNIFLLKVIRTTKPVSEKIFRVAVCGGAGSFLLGDAIANKADIFVSGDFKYHQFCDAENKITIADIGHFESEQFTVEIFYDIIKKNLPNFAAQIAEKNINPVIYII
ncbi:MAG: Nif3-like dinuclear metal center hexameric protein [Prevotellaceae bacterium]|jgi:dinuclear metal center YbgI/SA1388 family protein|nr:Nif3-like dinuclear metal center hexameric protein [Prevotellaceae bacterium]